MYVAPKNAELLLTNAVAEDLYGLLVAQLEKDFRLANENITFPTAILPEELKMVLHEKIYYLIQHKFAEYLNLLYIIDVPEKEIKQLNGSDLVELSGEVAFLILKREWQKVWFRNRM